MASRALSSIAIFLYLNIVFFTMVSSHSVPCPPPPSCNRCTPQPPSHGGQGGNPTPGSPSHGGQGGKPHPPMSPTPPSKGNNCPIDILKLGVCANVLGGLLGAVIGSPPRSQCCTLLQGLADLDAAVCLCTAIKANILGINLNVPVSLTLLLNQCGKTNTSAFKCT